MTHFCQTRRDAVRYVTDIIQSTRPGYALTITIGPGRSEVSSVGFAIDVSSVDTQTPTSLPRLPSISDKAPDYTFPPGQKSADAGLD